MSTKPLAPIKKKKSGRKKLKPLNKVKSFPSKGGVGDGKLSVDELLSKTMMRSLSMPSGGTLMVPPSKLKIDTIHEHDELRSLSPSRMNSQRSWGSDSLDGSEYTYTSRLTQRELLHEIANRAEQNLEPPAFVTPLEELNPGLFSWNHKLPQNFNPHRPVVNIIGCMQSTELILAQADLRSRHRLEKMEAKQKICEEKVRQIDETIQLKYTRAERYAALVALKQRQMMWLKIIQMSLYLHNVFDGVKRHVKVGTHFSHTIRAGLVIKHACKRFMRRHMVHKFKFKFLVLFRKKEMMFRMGMRIARKKNAVQRIKTFLAEYKNHHRMNVVVHKYLMGVRKVQRNIRDYLACKHAKITSLAVLWTRLEQSYVKGMLDKRKLAKRNTGKIQTKKGEQVDYGDMDQKSLIEMKNQAKLWDRIDSKMEDKIKSLKATGVIMKDNEDEQAEKFMLPAKRRWAALLDMLHFLRKEFYQSQRAVIRKKMDFEAAFSETHALDMLRGRTHDIDRIVNDKFNKHVVSLKYKPFMLFSSINHRLIQDRIAHAHEVNETWAIKMNDFSNYSTKYAKRKSKEKSLAATAMAAMEASKLGSLKDSGHEGEEED